MKKIEQTFTSLKEDILNGKYGKSGDLFIPIRRFSEKFNLTFYTAHTIYHKLEKEGLITIIKRKWYITLGIATRNSALKKLANKKRIGLHTKEIDNPYITSIISSLKSILNEQGFSLIIQTSENNSQNEIEILNNFIALGCVGVLNFPNTETKIVDYYKNYPLPMVFIGRKITIDKTYTLPSVLTDNFETGGTIARTLLDKGYKSFYFVTHKNFSSSINNRLIGFRSQLDKVSNELFTDANIFEADYSDNSSIRNFCRNIIKEASENNPVAIFCINDLFAAKILTTLIPLKADIPNLIGIVGYDDLPICEYTYPTITSVSYSFKEMANKSIKLLFSITSTEPQHNKAYYIPNYLVQRKSSALNKS